jgi:tyrosyl-tRNA synthetase
LKNETIHIENLSIGYPGKSDVKVVADGICAGINSGELTCLLGANGVGKSTLLRTLSAFQPKLGGEIRIQGKEIESYTDKQLSRVISVVLTEKCDIRNMSVTELIGLGRSPYTGFWGTLTKEDRQVVERAVALVGIPHLAHRMVHTLSDGERQKVMIAKALAQETPVIYLDEPTAFLDFPSKVEMMQLLHHLSRQTDKTIFLSTHDLELALQIADKIWLMDKANGVTIGTPEDLSLNGSLSSFFARKGIVFDLETGLFRVDNEYTTQIRLSSEAAEGMSFTEFTYQLVQGYDFLHLYKAKGCTLQMGGSDQWGNITTGTELVRRKEGGKAYALTCPLITKADGTKFGKSEGGNIWLDAARTSPYKFYQYWLNTSDVDAEKYIKIFTFLTKEAIEELTLQHREAPHLRLLQKKLAEEITIMVHSKEDLENAIKASGILFGNATADDLKQLDEATFLEVFDGVPQAEIAKNEVEAGLDIITVLNEKTGFFKSNGEARRALTANSISVNREKVKEDFILTANDLINDRFVLLQSGKKNYFVIRVV